MDKKKRAASIRKGNELFNNREFDKAIKIFIMTDYKDGLARVGDYYFYEKKQPLMAFKFYKKAGMQTKVNEIFERMAFALGQWIGEDKVKDNPNQTNKVCSLPPVKVSLELKNMAEEILKKKL